MYIAILGRQPNLGIAELEALHMSAVTWFSEGSALVDTPDLTVEQLGGSIKAGKVILKKSEAEWNTISQAVARHYTKKWEGHSGKITLGISAYGFNASARDVQKTGLLLKQQLKKSGVSLRLIPNNEPALNSATSHHNKLGLSANKVELIVVRSSRGEAVVAESTGAQNITALARRDQGRPKRDPFVGMLPPKLAQIIINLASPSKEHGRLLDPFCGTGVILQEAALMGFPVYGTDLSDKMVDYSKENLAWLASRPSVHVDAIIEQADATTAHWKQPISAIACEAYLGQPFSAPPSAEKLTQVTRTCNGIITAFLENAASQVPPGTPLCVAVPAWRAKDGSFTHLPLIKSLDRIGYTKQSFKTVHKPLLYYREDQIVARELLCLVRSAY